MLLDNSSTYSLPERPLDLLTRSLFCSVFASLPPPFEYFLFFFLFSWLLLLSPSLFRPHRVLFILQLLLYTSTIFAGSDARRGTTKEGVWVENILQCACLVAQYKVLLISRQKLLALSPSLERLSRVLVAVVVVVVLLVVVPVVGSNYVDRVYEASPVGRRNTTCESRMRKKERERERNNESKRTRER